MVRRTGGKMCTEVQWLEDRGAQRGACRKRADGARLAPSRTPTGSGLQRLELGLAMVTSYYMDPHDILLRWSCSSCQFWEDSF